MKDEFKLTKRDYFAAMAMGPLISSSNYILFADEVANDISRQCIMMADALIRQLEK